MSSPPTKDQPHLNNSGKPLPAIALKWGKSPASPPSTAEPTSASTSTSDAAKPDFSTFYTPTEQAALREKGINPTLKAEMEWNKSRSQGRGIWGKIAGTALGGGVVK